MAGTAPRTWFITGANRGLGAAMARAALAAGDNVVACGRRLAEVEAAFAGAGNSLPPMLVSVPLTALRVPLAFYLAGRFGTGIAGIWWVISVSTGLKGLLIAAWFRLGRWKHSRI